MAGGTSAPAEPAAHFLAAAQLQIGAQIQAARHAVQVGRADQVGLQARKLPFAKIGMAKHQGLRNQEPQNGVAQEFKLLVVVGRRTRTGAGFVG